MVLLTTLVSLIWLACSSAQLDPLVKINVPFKITPVDYLSALYIQPDVVYGAKDCGGFGRITQFTHQNCKSGLPTVACLGEIGKPGKWHIYFVAGQDAKDVLVRASIITSQGDTKIAEVPVPETTLKAGHSYALQASAEIEPELLGKLFRGRLEVLRANDKSTQACLEVDYIAYKP